MENSVKQDVIFHYDKLIEENNDPVFDPKPLKDYMDKWDGKEFIDLLDIKPHHSVLEVGVGTGRLAVKTACLCNELWGIDISPATSERARENLSSFGNCRIICGDFEEYIFDSVFDVAYSSLTFMHVEDKRGAMEKVYSLLKDGGRFVLSIDKNQSEIIDAGTSRVKVFPDSFDMTEKYLKNAGFCIEKVIEKEFSYIFLAVK